MTMRRLTLIFAASALSAWAQTHSYSQEDIEEGRRRYQTNCIGCHGVDGAAIAGIDLGRGKFKRVTSDDELAKVIVEGVPGTGMPGTPLFPSRVFMLISYLRNMSDLTSRKSIAAATGEPGRGKLLFEGKAGCAGCHRILGQGGRKGPDLSETGHFLRPAEIEMSMLEPDAAYASDSPPYRAVLNGGETVLGFLLNQNSDSIQLKDDRGNLRSLLRSDLKEAGQVKSWMPSYRGQLSAQELADIIAYLGNQKGAQ